MNKKRMNIMITAQTQKLLHKISIKENRKMSTIIELAIQKYNKEAKK